MFAKLFGGRAKAAASKFSGRTDFLEAVCAGCALVAAADGEISDAEIEATTSAIAANGTLSGGFNSAEIAACADRMLKRAASGRTGRMQLQKEIEDIKADPEMCESVVLAMLDVADQGGIDEAERKVIERISALLSVNLKALEAA